MVRRRHKAQDEVSFQLTPMIDMTFLLLIFDMVTQKITEQERSVPIRLPVAVTAATPEKVERDVNHGGIWKINPLADWTTEQVRDYLRRNRLPYNRLLDEGYPSIGCACCTRPVEPGADPRSGRWWWEQEGHKECGLHVRNWNI